MIHTTSGEQHNFDPQDEQQSWLPSTSYDTQLNYWKQQLAGNSPLLLPTDRPRAVNYSYQNAKRSLLLPKELVKSLNALSQQAESTLFITMLAAFNVLLFRYTRQEDILVGSLMATPSQMEQTESINTLVLRTNLANNPTFQELLAQVCQITKAAYKHSDLPFEQIVEALKPKQSLNTYSLFQVMFVLKPLDSLLLTDGNHTILDENKSSLVFNSLKLENETTTNLDLALILKETLEGIDGYIEYNANLFEAATIDRLIGHFQTLLESIVTNPEQQISNLGLLTAAEKQTLLVDWNQTQANYPNVCIHQLFESQVEQTPEAIAITFEDQSLTYQQLNNKANQVAHYLQARGVKPDVLVALCLERSLNMVVGLLGILKAGGGYVPLDPAYPPERVSFMLSDAQVPVLLTQSSLLTGLPKHEAQVVCLDTDWQAISQLSQDNPVSTVASNHLAYVIYTSGSTGKPKGVQLCHQSVSNFLCSMSQQPGLTDQDILVAVTTICFDIAVLELYLPLIMGAKVVLVGRDVATNGVKLLEKLTQSGATIMQATPATWRLLLASEWKNTPRLKILCGGEAMPRELANQLLDKSTSLWNVYGPTETTVWSTAHQVETSRLLARSQDAPESIGRPIANTQIYLLDAHLQPVPIGIPGELHIGGDGLARGYLNRPELTAEKFIPDPLSDIPGARLYKTGDLARYLPDGNIDYIGRIDNQVKIRGYRIEVGEIEAVLRKHPSIQETVVIAQKNSQGDQRLVAYYVSPKVIPNSELRQLIKHKLPDYMVPSAFVRLEALPLTPNGKIDRRALPAVETIQQEPEANYVAPRNDLELQLTKIWEKVLGIQHIGIKDNFFELGGHSLLAIRLLTEIEKSFNKNLPLVSFIEAQTIEQLANLLDNKEARNWQTLVKLKAGTNQAALFCIHAVWGNVLFYQKLAANLEPNQAVYGLQAQGLDGQKPPCTSLTEMAAHYIQEIRTVQPNGPYHIAGFSFGGLVAFEIARQLDEQGQNIALLAILDTPAPGYHIHATDPGSSKLSQLLNRAFFHVAKLFKLSLQEQLSYLKGRILWHMKEGKLNFGYKFYLRYITRSLQELRILKISAANHQARNGYVVQSYRGQITLFQATQRPAGFDNEPELGWGKLAKGGVNCYEIPGLHTDMMEEPQVKIVADKLQYHLNHLQADLEKVDELIG